MNQKTHIHYFDYLRVIGAVSVIYMHVVSSLLRGEVNLQWHLADLLTSFAFTAVPLFLMMSGYLTLSGETAGDIGLLVKKRLPRLVFPLAGWSVVSLLYTMYSNKTWSVQTFLDGLLSALSTPNMIHYWYMYTLIALYVISPVLAGGLRSLDEKGHKYVFLLAALVSAKAMLKAILPNWADRVLDVDLVSKLSFYTGHLATFVLGYYLGNLKKRIPNWLLMTGAGLILAVIATGTYVLTVRSGEYNATFQGQNAGFEVLLAALIFLLFKQNGNRPSKILNRVPLVPLSLSIYLMHVTLLKMMYAAGFAVNSLRDALLGTAVNLVVCFFTMKTVATIKPLCYLATGMSFAAACRSCNWVYTYRWVKDWLNRKRSVSRSEPTPTDNHE